MYCKESGELRKYFFIMGRVLDYACENVYLSVILLASCV